MDKYGGYEDRYSASIAGAEAVLASAPSWGGSVDSVQWGTPRDLSPLPAAEHGAGTWDPAAAASPPRKPLQARRPPNSIAPAFAHLPLRSQPPPPKVYTSEDAVRAKVSATVRNCCDAVPRLGLGAVLASLYTSITETLLGPTSARPPSLRRSMSSRIANEPPPPDEDDEDEGR